MTQMQLVKRIERLEQDLKTLKQELSKTRSAGERPSAEKLYGLFRNDPYFEKAVAAGAAYRRSLRPRARRSKPKQK
jgi:hypothetical protein